MINKKGYSYVELVVSIAVGVIIFILLNSLFINYNSTNVILQNNTKELNNIEKVLVVIQEDLIKGYRVKHTQNTITIETPKNNIEYLLQNNVLYRNGNKVSSNISITWEDVSQSINGKRGKKIYKFTTTYNKKINIKEMKHISLEKYIVTNEDL